jgi:hypothetical protein
MPEGPCRRLRRHYASLVELGDPRFDTRTMPTKRHVWGTRQSRRGDDPLGGFAVFLVREFLSGVATRMIIYCLVPEVSGAGLTCLCLWVLFADGAGALEEPAELPAGGWPPVAGPFCAIANEVPATSSTAIIVRFFRLVIIHPRCLSRPRRSKRFRACSVPSVGRPLQCFRICTEALVRPVTQKQRRLNISLRRTSRR